MIESKQPPARWWHTLEDGRIQCDLCPRLCRLHEGQRAFCFVRQRTGDRIALTTYGRSTGFCVDPIEKKPLFHFYPGSHALSFGTAGCNLGCRYCQNWSISKAREIEDLSVEAQPGAIARAARQRGCRSVAFTYNDPVIWAEYAIDTAEQCHKLGIDTVAVTAGYIMPEPRAELFGAMDAANVDLKAFTQQFYEKLCFANLQPVLETLDYLRRETSVWFEVTTLLIPGENDSEAEIRQLCEWFLEHLGPEVPLHFTAFHPSFRMLATPSTPPETLFRARRQAVEVGLRHVYTGNIADQDGQSTYCASCGQRLIRRYAYLVDIEALGADGCCSVCGHTLAGRFAASSAGVESVAHSVKAR